MRRSLGSFLGAGAMAGVAVGFWACGGGGGDKSGFSGLDGGNDSSFSSDGTTDGLTFGSDSGDAGGPGHEVGWQDRDEAALGVVVGEPGQGADLGEATGVGQPLDALADGEPAGSALPAHLLRAAHGLRRFPAPADLLDLRRPALLAGLCLVPCSAHRHLTCSAPPRTG